ncbi:flavodoxin family protein [Desulfonatronum thiodismutans]|uniref:flavodoxin family protein n=1 Tax=Desulfonatronum thiodismutans TaxID=159290 RepID=UPI000A4B5E77|nr:flavodoxin family protein [Desulfonatronum thiodismutans]
MANGEREAVHPVDSMEEIAPYAVGDFTSPAIFSCSPRSGGNSDNAAEFFREGVRQAGGRGQLFYLRDYTVHPCLGCIRCEQDPRGECFLTARDQSSPLFQALLAAPMLFIAAPIYFYHLPSQFKAWIDRSQSYYLRWERGDPLLKKLPSRPAVVNLVAGRRQGERLFEGALLTLKYFLTTFNFTIQEHHAFRGIDASEDLRMHPQAGEELVAAGREAWTNLVKKNRA